LQGSEAIRAEVRAAQAVPGVNGPGTGGTLYVPFVFRRAGLNQQ